MGDVASNGEKDISRILINAVHLCFFQTRQPVESRVCEEFRLRRRRGRKHAPVKESGESDGDGERESEREDRDGRAGGNATNLGSSLREKQQPFVGETTGEKIERPFFRHRLRASSSPGCFRSQPRRLESLITASIETDNESSSFARDAGLIDVKWHKGTIVEQNRLLPRKREVTGYAVSRRHLRPA